ncbi:5-oxoprolinase subunit PxpB [Vibrio mangrovi]|uniref:5-oxoprolinase subunit PxpB n=1 Tax=Vibrio mangrovi TaxID=474394 RepID=A0A1Y6IMC8_9VIBR|nr:5-oxoprolinase subunit PxpB [Vibrio mangrovi]MDW6004394.1 5-oxoprolinase subunit PxpB [Vibrio mangrovi]SMR98807.1 Kinase A inhibitor [Vibrio mangrovi]
MKEAERMPEVYRLGEHCFVLQAPEPVTLARQQKIWMIAEQLRARTEIVDIVPGMNNLTVRIRPDVTEHESNEYENIRRLFYQYWTDDDVVSTLGRQLEIAVKFGGSYGPDLAHVADSSGLSIDEVIRIYTAAEYTVYFLGFQPGFAYLGGLPNILATPRHASPRTRIPAGSVGIGGAQTGIYPNASPGGWQVIGHTDVVLFDPQRDQPSFWLPGDRVRFTVTEIHYD